ncbi:PspA/IM30 family protein [Desulfobacterales bacterium HSG17]|nr:PspA/IM30 family protein [Desulfobacterales bacterium HSG17]
MSFFTRVFKIGQAEAHNAIEKLEDPVKLTEQGIRDLKKDLQGAMTSLAEVKAVAIRTKRDADNKKKLAADYERKAMLLLQKAQNGSLDMADAERLATDAMGKKEAILSESGSIIQEADRHNQMVQQLQANVNKIKSKITKFENELVTLRSRQKNAASTKKINSQLAKVDSSGTVAMLERMKAKVEEDEALAIAYGDIVPVDDDAAINAALEGPSTTATDSLAALKARMGLPAPGAETVHEVKSGETIKVV